MRSQISGLWLERDTAFGSLAYKKGYVIYHIFVCVCVCDKFLNIQSRDATKQEIACVLRRNLQLAAPVPIITDVPLHNHIIYMISAATDRLWQKIARSGSLTDEVDEIDLREDTDSRVDTDTEDD